MTTLIARQSRVTVGILWTLQIFSAALFVFAAINKLAGDPAMVQAFATIGVGQWFRYMTAGIELGSAVLLLIPATAAYGAAALVVTMVGAIVTHLFIIGGSPIPAVVLLATTATIASLRWSDR
jgi:uncharacterized membrane protein YphA (DoxX/SURF4 family)